MRKYLKYIISISILIIFIFIVVIYYINSTDNENINKEIIKVEKKKIKKEENKIEYVYVDIKGAVKCEGVYKLNKDSRVIDVINASGGLKENADTFNINLSKKISDEMFIIIYTKEEIDRYKNKTLSTVKINNSLINEMPNIDESNDAQIKIDINDNNISKININIADKNELLKIPGIGESKAENIIKYRNENGNFKTIDDIKNVTGIGESIFEKIKDNITI